MILAGNGSDDLLTIITRAFVGPGDAAAFASPSYLLYSTIVSLQNGRAVFIPYGPGWALDAGAFVKGGYKLAFLANPDSPSGSAQSRGWIAALANQLE